MVTLKVLFLAIVPLITVFAVVIVYLHYQLLSILRDAHPVKWQELGSPTLVLNNSMKNSLAVLKFLRNREHLGMDDQRLTKISVALWYLGRIYLIFFTVVILLLVIVIKE